MCIAVFAWQSHPDYPLIVASNRDEFYTRTTRPAAWWGQTVSLLAGRDEEAGGTWLGINRQGRFALVTNVRAPTERNPHSPSRGALVVSALQAGQDLPGWMRSTAERSRNFNGFNLIAGDSLSSATRTAQLNYFSNRLEDPVRTLAPGIYGLSNAFLDTPWPKVTRAVTLFALQVARRVETEALLHLLADRTIARDSQLPSTGIPLDWERALSSIQIRANGYGTRTSTVLLVRRDGLVSFTERSFDVEDPLQASDKHYEFVVSTTSAVPSDLDSNASG